MVLCDDAMMCPVFTAVCTVLVQYCTKYKPYSNSDEAPVLLCEYGTVDYCPSFINDHRPALPYSRLASSLPKTTFMLSSTVQYAFCPWFYRVHSQDWV